MAKIRQILKHVSIDIAKGKRRCRRNGQHIIEPGEHCLQIRDEGSPYCRNYCKNCATPILQLCANQLAVFQSSLGLDENTGAGTDAQLGARLRDTGNEETACLARTSTLSHGCGSQMALTFYDRDMPYVDNYRE